MQVKRRTIGIVLSCVLAAPFVLYALFVAVLATLGSMRAGQDHEIPLTNGYLFVSSTGIWAIVDNTYAVVYPKIGPSGDKWCRLFVENTIVAGVKTKPFNEWFIIDTHNGEVTVYNKKEIWEQRLKEHYRIEQYTLAYPK